LAEVDKNEIAAEATAALYYVPGVLTVIRNGMAVDLATDGVCAAGTDSFIGEQALRLSMSIEDFG